MYTINENEVIATKTWTVADIVTRLVDVFGYSEESITDEMLNDIINKGGEWDALKDCYDWEWAAIDKVIYDAGIEECS